MFNRIFFWKTKPKHNPVCDNSLISNFNNFFSEQLPSQNVNCPSTANCLTAKPCNHKKTWPSKTFTTEKHTQSRNFAKSPADKPETHEKN